jgi:hypothetical protein
MFDNRTQMIQYDRKSNGGMMPKLKQVVNSFPTEKVEALLSAWWDSKLQSPLKRPSKVPTKGTVFALQPELSSQQAVGILVSCIGLLGYRPSVDVIQKGGYSSKASFVDGLLTAIGAEFSTKQIAPQASQAVKGDPQNATTTV